MKSIKKGDIKGGNKKIKSLKENKEVKVLSLKNFKYLKDTVTSFMYRYRYFIIFGVFFVTYFKLAHHLIFDLHHVYGDAVTRAEKPFLVLYDNEPKLAALGFIWPPLPSLVQLPVLAMFKGLAIYGFSSNLTTVFFGTLNVLFIFRFIERIPIKKVYQLLFLALYGFNPMIVFYAINGMSETTFLFFVISTAWYFFRWQEDKRLYQLLGVGISLAAAFLTRYETFAFLIAVAGLIFLTVIIDYIKDTKIKLATKGGKIAKIKNKLGSIFKLSFNVNNFNKAISVVIFTLIPVVFTISAWAAVNFMIMGDPLYFFHGEYSVSEQSDVISGEALANAHNVVGSIVYSLKRVVVLFPIVLPAIIFLLLFSRRYSWQVWSMLLLALTIPFFEVFVHYLGKSFGWLRFFIYIIPFTFIILSAIWSQRKRVHGFVLSLIIIVLLISNVSSLIAMRTAKYGKEEFIATRALLTNRQVKDIDVGLESGGGIEGLDVSYDIDVAVVSYLKENLKPGQRVLVDDFIGFGIIINYGNPKVFINDSDKEFDAAVASPYEYTDYILVPSPHTTIVAKLDVFNRTYPEIFNEGADFLRLEKDFDNRWRLFRTVKTEE